MILNSFAILTVFVGLLRLLFALIVIGVAINAWRVCRRPARAEDRTAQENRFYLVALLAQGLLALNFVSWPFFYLLLQSYVPEWPGIMCIYGVTQIGKGTVGTSRLLPELVEFLQFAKPALVFASGGWFLLYGLNRATRTGSLLPRLLLALVPLGLFAAAEAATELTYVAIPKKEVFVSAGCCMAEDENAQRFVPPALVGDAGRPWLYAGFLGANAIMILALRLVTGRRDAGPGSLTLAFLVGWGAIVLAVSGLFLVEAAAPRLLQLPMHHCAYDLIPQVPEAVIAVTLFVVGCFSLGWAGIARWFGVNAETAPFVGGTVVRLLRLSLWGFSTSLAMLALELLLA